MSFFINKFGNNKISALFINQQIKRIDNIFLQCYTSNVRSVSDCSVTTKAEQVQTETAVSCSVF